MCVRLIEHVILRGIRSLRFPVGFVRDFPIRHSRIRIDDSATAVVDVCLRRADPVPREVRLAFGRAPDRTGRRSGRSPAAATACALSSRTLGRCLAEQQLCQQQNGGETGNEYRQTKRSISQLASTILRKLPFPSRASFSLKIWHSYSRILKLGSLCRYSNTSIVQGRENTLASSIVARYIMLSMLVRVQRSTT